jgi:hypothetical protein
MFLHNLSFTVLSCLCVAQAAAASLAIGVPPGGIGVDLHLARDEIELVDTTVEPDTRLSRVGITLTETVGDELSIGLLLGYASASQTDQPLTAGMRFTGNYLGVNVHGGIPLGGRLRIGLMGQFLYHWMSDDLEDLRVELEWAQADAALTLQAQLAPILTAYAGPLWSTIEVDQKSRGDVNATTEFVNRRESGGVFGLLLEVDYRGWIGLEARRGPFDGVALSFQRRF